MFMFVNVSEMFEELQEKAKLFRAELEGYVFLKLASEICKSMLNFFTIYWNLIFVLVITSMTSMSVEHKCYHTVDENSHIKRFCILMQFIWLTKRERRKRSAVLESSHSSCSGFDFLIIHCIKYFLLSLEKRADISPRRHWFSREKAYQEREQKFHTDEMSPPRCR